MPPEAKERVSGCSQPDATQTGESIDGRRLCSGADESNTALVSARATLRKLRTRSAPHHR